MILKTQRLILRPFSLEDAPDVQRLAGHPEIAKTTGAVPHPYEDGMAEEWIGLHEGWRNDGVNHVFAATLMETGDLVGAMDLVVRKNHHSGILGYWVGVDYWNKGYCTEGVAALLQLGFQQLNLNRISADHMGYNPSSGRVMEKNGMKKEGVRRQAFLKNGEYVDLVMYSILRSEWSPN